MDKITLEMENLVSNLHARGRLRVWSIIISIFGDSIQPHGGTVAASTLGAITDQLRVEPGALRSALSRLGKEGWIKRHKIGRTSQYSLTRKGVEVFVPASQRIYTMHTPAFSPVWTVAITGGSATDEKEKLTLALLSEGFLNIGRGIFLLSGKRNETSAPFPDCLLIEGSLENVPDWLRESLGKAEEADLYSAILTNFSGLNAALADGASITPLQAITARTLLTHDWRRAALRSADLPSDFYPEGWLAEPCRSFVAVLYNKLSPAAEEWLSRQPELTELATPDVANRFMPS